MKPALGFRQPQLPKTWQDLPSGEMMVTGINELLADWWPKFFGYHLLKVGDLSTQISSEACPIKHQVDVCFQPSKGVIADIDDLPFIEHSVDVCLLSHALEFTLDPHHVIREANRVLIPNGYMVLTGYNPFSAVGLNKLLPYRRKSFPWNERFFSPNRIKDWLHLMGYEILADERILYRSLNGQLNNGVIAKQWQRFASNYLTSLGSVYIIIAKKRRFPLTPIKPKWQIRPNFKPVNVSSMNSSNRSPK
ncbi:MAG: class I SAM-dependent methyltransferase [Thalassotalea sp.]